MRARAAAPLLLLLLAVMPGLEASGARRRAKAAHPKPRTKSHHLARENAASSKGKGRVPPAARRLLPAGRWRPEVAQAIEKVLAAYGNSAPDYTSADPPVAAFSLEDAVVTGSIGEALFYRLVTRADFRFSDDFWRRVPDQCGAARARAAYEVFRRQPQETWANDPYYRIYRKTLFRCQESIAREWGLKRLAAWRVRLMAGFQEKDLRPYAQAAIDEEFRRPVGWETVEEFAGDPDPVKVRVGLRRIQEMEDLFQAFRDRGFDPWVMSDAYQWAAEEIAKEYGVDPSRVMGVRTKVSDEGVLSDEILIPVPKEAGRAEAATMFIGRSPVLAMGNRDDASLLDYGRGLRILLVEPERASQPPPGGRKWLVQPRFSPDRAPQERGHPLPVASAPGREGGEGAAPSGGESASTGAPE